jgi:hypothetical protein
MADIGTEAWAEVFWEADLDSTDDGGRAIRILGELFSANVIHRVGDDLWDRGMNVALRLSTEDQYLVRRIEDAARVAQGAE